MTYHRVCNKINLTGITYGTGYAERTGTLKFNPVLNGVHVPHSIFSLLCNIFVDILLSFVILLLVIALGVPRTRPSDYPFGIIKHFLYNLVWKYCFHSQDCIIIAL